ncbi:hypothetical protein F8M41_025183 [Gigaspora margarita]|uniref:Uncharacterized protein n=1 Tax=Gigaspora margarita TaxID=4874 RepID=A0A8H4ESZ9_GIGMA|nr:hypothetical protein F8M41_025183 [Gigaspora margarita]
MTKYSKEFRRYILDWANQPMKSKSGFVKMIKIDEDAQIMIYKLDELQQRTKKAEIQLKTTCENLKIKIKKESLEEYFLNLIQLI